VYAGDPGTAATPEPPHQLAGFAKCNLRPGQTGRVVIHVAARAFAHWDPATGKWVVPDGTYRLYAGTSSADLPLSATLRLTGVRP
jgi:beta-glucosidase